MGNALQPGKKYTYKDYLTWPTDERWELINGRAYCMTPAPSREHQAIVTDLTRQIAGFLHKKQCKVYVAPFDVRLTQSNESDDNAENVAQPDISVICDPSKLDERGCNGAPDWIIEVLSPATAKKDLQDKFELYQQAGVKEYWTVYPGEIIVGIHRLDNGKYQRHEAFDFHDSIDVGIFEELKIAIDID